MGGEGQEHDCALGSNLNQSRTAAVDPKHAFRMGPMNGRYAPECGRWVPERDGCSRGGSAADAISSYLNGERPSLFSAVSMPIAVAIQRQADRMTRCGGQTRCDQPVAAIPSIRIPEDFQMGHYDAKSASRRFRTLAF
jgi:hypothetical protein